MTSSITPRSPLPASRAPESDDTRLRKTAQQLEGVFVQQLYKAMRETVPQGEGVADGGSGEDMFTGLMDQHLAADTPTQWAHGLADAAYRQLRHTLPGATPGTTAATTPLAPLVPAAPAPISLAPAPAAPISLVTSATSGVVTPAKAGAR